MENQIKDLVTTTAATTAVATVVSQATQQLTTHVAKQAGHLFRTTFKHWSSDAKGKAKDNIKDFTERVDEHIRKIIERGAIPEEKVEEALKDPEVLLLLEQAVARAAHPRAPESNILLAKLIAERLTCETDSLASIATELACERVGHITGQQLKLLALRYTFGHLDYQRTSQHVVGGDARGREVTWAVHLFRPYVDVQLNSADTKHLEALGCLSYPRGTSQPSLTQLLRSEVHQYFDVLRLQHTTVGAHIAALWKGGGISDFDLTSTGSLIGMYVADLLANRDSDVSKWRP
jgi:hypothetical protein